MPQTVTVVGPPGIGKSRLIRELITREAGGGTPLVGRCAAYKAGVCLRDPFDRRRLLRRAPRGLRRAGRKLETHLAVGAANQERRERPALSGNEPMQEIGPSRGKQLLYLLGFDGPLQDDAPRAEVAASRRADAVFAGVGDRLLEYSSAALRARPEGGQA